MIMCPVADGADNQSVNASGLGRTAFEQASPSGVNLALRPALSPGAEGRLPIRWCPARVPGAALARSMPDPTRDHLLFLNRLIYIKSYR